MRAAVWGGGVCVVNGTREMGYFTTRQKLIATTDRANKTLSTGTFRALRMHVFVIIVEVSSAAAKRNRPVSELGRSYTTVGELCF